DQRVTPAELADPAERERLARRHVEERLIACFVIRQGSFRFEPGVAPPADLLRADITVAQLVLEGVRRHMPLIELTHEIEAVRRRVVHATADAPAALSAARLAGEQARVRSA